MKKETKPTAKSTKKTAAKQKKEVTESTKEVQTKSPKVKKVKAIVLKRFHGVVEDKAFSKGDMFSGTIERVECLINKGFIKLISVEVD